MATRARDVSPFTVPVRARAAQARNGNIPAKLALADRIADLPGIRVADDDPAGGSRNVDVILPAASLHRQRQPMLLCRIGGDGIVVYGLNDRDRHQILSRRWGRLHQTGVLLFLPRDDEELETAWRILCRAYDALIADSASIIPERATWFDGFPLFSRTNLQ